MGDLTPLSEIMDDFMQDLKSGRLAEDLRLEDTAFKRGYEYAYNRAITDVFTLLEKGMHFEQARALAFLHCDLIGSWRASNTSTEHTPPFFNKRNLLETLEHRNRPQIEDYEEGE
jgi:hypothetical protein